MTLKVVVLDDDEMFNKVCTKYLQAEGFEVVSYTVSAEFIQDYTDKLEIREIDYLVCDLMMPEPDGLQTVEQIIDLPRKKGKLKIAVYSADNNYAKRLELLKLGAVDYLTKETSLEELVLRIRSHSAFEKAQADESTDQFVLDLRSQELRLGAKALELTKVQLDFINYMFTSADGIINREYIATKLLGYHTAIGTRTVDNHISRTRKIFLELAPDVGDALRTRSGVGWIFELPKKYSFKVI